MSARSAGVSRAAATSTVPDPSLLIAPRPSFSLFHFLKVQFNPTRHPRALHAHGGAVRASEQQQQARPWKQQAKLFGDLRPNSLEQPLNHGGPPGAPFRPLGELCDACAESSGREVVPGQAAQRAGSSTQRAARRLAAAACCCTRWPSSPPAVLLLLLLPLQRRIRTHECL